MPEDARPEVEEKQNDLRGGSVLHNGLIKSVNFAMIFGSAPDMGVLADSKMIQNCADIMIEKVDKTFSVL